ncbi:MAG: hypothetical protein QOJ64_3099 [Acidobacteriota bacterium]|jgi:hypothetical protein|nr:hypothetical protein [Acidobacteriota bacterium]
MKRVPYSQSARRAAGIFFTLLLAFSPAAHFVSLAQSPAPTPNIPNATAEAEKPSFRLERTPVAGGAELLTIFGDLDGLKRENGQSSEVPLVSVVRDTLGDDNPENDRLRYVWMLTYTKPTFGQRLASAIPFLYTRVGNKHQSGTGAPPPIMDLAGAKREVWERFFWTAIQSLLLDSYGLPLKTATRTFRHNLSDYRKAHIVRALGVLSLYQSESGTASVFTPGEMADINARLILSEKAFGGIMDDIYLQRVYQKETTLTRDLRGHNWELLRQRAEAESLYFEPLEMPDGSATHAMLWVSRPDLGRNQARRFDKRFLNIADPWQDTRLRNWKGYTETRYFDAENRPVDADAEGARAVEMVPLALYGLDFPKIPILLVDFRDAANPKRREMSRRVLEDIARNVLGLSRLALPYFLGRTVYDFVTGKRGMDINQPSRLKTYSQLKLLISLSASLDPELRNEISRRLERVSLNPLENDLEMEAKLAREQYASLLAYVNRPDGLPARLDRDRREEMVNLKHGRTGQTMFRLANILSFGLYTHRETPTPEMKTRLDIGRQFAFHQRFLREVARASPQVEVVWNIEDVRRSLRFIIEHGALATGTTASVAARIFARTEDEETRSICLNGLYRINNETAKKELLRTYRDPRIEARWRTQSAEYLRLAVKEEQRIAPADAKAILSVVNGNQ